MARVRHRLEHSLILLDDYLHPLFGADKGAAQPFMNLKGKLGDYPDGYDSTGRSFLAQNLSHHYQRDKSELFTYDDNVKRHLAAINARRPQDEQITLKYFQLLALLYTEHVLQRVFGDAEAFAAELNQLVAQRNALQRKDKFDEFGLADLHKLAYWMATGSGKTLIMHVNLHQVHHYQQQSGQKPFENILLITPNAGLSQQHIQELRLSGLPVQQFSQSATRVSADTVQVIEITKFTTGSSGPQTVNVAHFEGRNLVLVDEGHRGASGEVWFGYRDQLAAKGFTFEYSATFGEALNSGNKPSDLGYRHAYGKSIVFDYSYRYFHGDGYGKDYAILNLPQSYDYDDRDTLLLANLLSLYQQTWVHLENQAQMRAYHIQRPLLMFVGHTVQAGKTRSRLTRSDRASLSDVLDMVRFMSRVVSQRAWAVQTIADILQGQSGLSDENGVDIFLHRFTALLGHFTPDALYDGLLEAVFQAPAPGPLHLANVRNAAGEISLRVGTAEAPFGVINIGDDVNFLNMAARKGLGLMIDPPDALRKSLFETINHSGSTVNILVGAKKFTEGWSSWRVSGMGLLNVGRSEGSEVIQMFGRGVRLLGYQRSLKRSSVLDGAHPLHLPLLETLNIFSVNGDYLAQFKQALGREGIIEGHEEIHLPIKFDTFEAEQPQLYVIRTRQDARFGDQPTFALQAIGNARVKPEIDLSPRVQVAASAPEEVTLHAHSQETYIHPLHLDLLDWDALYLDILIWRRQRGYDNMALGREVLREIMRVQDHDGQAHSPYYTLYAPASLIVPRSFADAPRLQAIVSAILKQYAERFYNYQRQKWESENLEYRLLDKSDDNLLPSQTGYLIKVNRERPDLVEAIEELLQQGDKLYQEDQVNFPNLVFDRHLYTPLVVQGYYDGNRRTFQPEQDIKSVPTGLNQGEARFVWELRQYAQGNGAAQLGNRKLYLLRNLSRGKGIGFFEAANFYPDFILWIVDGERQSITFIDPKGLAMLRPNDFDNPKIQLYRTLKDEIEPRLGDPQVSLDAYIISAESYAKTVKYFGDPHHPYSMGEFREQHVLFPGFAVGHLFDALL
jgi:hypothetical protein